MMRRAELNSSRSEAKLVLWQSDDFRLKTIDSTSAFLTSRPVPKQRSPPLCTQRSLSLDFLIRRCRESLQRQDKRVKRELDRQQQRIKRLLAEIKPEAGPGYEVNRRRRVLQGEDCMSHTEVRKLIAANRVKFKQARVLSIGS